MEINVGKLEELIKSLPDPKTEKEDFIHIDVLSEVQPTEIGHANIMTLTFAKFQPEDGELSWNLRLPVSAKPGEGKIEVWDDERSVAPDAR